METVQLGSDAYRVSFDPDQTRNDIAGVRALAKTLTGAPMRGIGHLSTGLNVANSTRSLMGPTLERGLGR